MRKTACRQTRLAGYGCIAYGRSGNLHGLLFSLDAYLTNAASLRGSKQALQVFKRAAGIGCLRGKSLQFLCNAMRKLRVRGTYSVRRRDVLILPGVEGAESASAGVFPLCFQIDGYSLVGNIGDTWGFKKCSSQVLNVL